MSEETNERYQIEVGILKVFIRDTEADRSVAEFAGPDRLLAATAELNRLNDAEETARTGVTWQAWTPAEFLTEELPAVARRQRLEAHLAEVTEIEESLLRVLAEDAANLKRATALREKLEKELASPLSEPLAAQNAPEVDVDAYEPYGVSEAFPYGRNFVYKPQPY